MGQFDLASAQTIDCHSGLCFCDHPWQYRVHVATADAKFSDPHISWPPTVRVKNFSIFSNIWHALFECACC